MADAFDVDVVARRIRQLYVQIVRMRKEWSRYTPGTRYDYVWKQAAELCLRHGMDPAAHVMSLVESVERPYPYMLLGDVAVRRTMSKGLATANAQRESVQSQLTLLTSRLARGDDLAVVLMNPNEDISPAVRYTVAAKAGLAPIASMYRDDARVELMLNPALIEVLRPMLPPAFAGVLSDGYPEGATSTHSAHGARPADAGRSAAAGDAGAV